MFKKDVDVVFFLIVNLKKPVIFQCWSITLTHNIHFVAYEIIQEGKGVSHGQELGILNSSINVHKYGIITHFAMS